MTETITAALREAFERHRRFLWGLGYRLTGCAADADDVVQETFVRAMEHPPARLEELRPWLARVALNLGRDLLRRRRREGYAGPWLPSPIETEEVSPPSYEPRISERGTMEGPYDLLESVSFAFLLALEALTPRQRAVLLLRDVFDYSVRETAEAIGLSQANVKTTHHRARRAMRGYDRDRMLPTKSLQEQTRRALEQFLIHLGNQDVAGIEAMLAADARAVTDGGGEFLAALLPIVDRHKIVRLFLKLAERRARAPDTRLVFRTLNGLPAIVGESSPMRPRQAPRFVLRCDLDSKGFIRHLHVVVASRKLTAVSLVTSAPLPA